MQLESSDASDTGEILIETEQGRLMLKRGRCDQCINGGEADAFRSSKARNRGCFLVGGKSSRLKQVPHRNKPFNAINISGEPLQYLRHDDSSEPERLDAFNHPPQFTTCTAGR